MNFRTYIIRIILLLLLLSVAALPVAVAQTDDALRLVVLEDRTAHRATFEGDVTAHLYAFHGSEGDTVNISMVQSRDSILDPYLVLLGAAGEVYTEDDDSGEVPLSALIEDFTLPSDGTYFVLATMWEGLRAGPEPEATAQTTRPLSYEIVVTGNTAPPQLTNVGRFEFLRGEIEVGSAPIILEITQEEPIFYVTFRAREGDRVTIATGENANDATTSVDTMLYLFDPTGNRVAVNDDAVGRGLFSAIEDFEIQQDGVYLIWATAFNFNEAYDEEWAGSGTFILFVE